LIVDYTITQEGKVICLWHRLQILISRAQLKWLKAESYTRGKSIAEIIRELIDGAMSQRRKEP